MKYGYKEIRRCNAEKLIRLCVRENWYTCGSNEEYNAMLDKVRNTENFTADDVVEIASDIVEHSEGIYAGDIENVMFKISNVACDIFYERV